MKKEKVIKVSVYYAKEFGTWCVFVDHEAPISGESAFIARWKTEGDAEMHAEIIRCAMAWEPSRAGRRWRQRTRPGRRAGDKET